MNPNSLLLFVDFDGAAADFGSGQVVIVAEGIIVDIVFDVVYLVPNSNSEAVNLERVALVDIGIDSRQHEFVTSLTVDRTRALIFGLGSCHYQPIIALTMEVQISNLEPELSFSSGYLGALVILGDEAEVCLSG